MRILYSGLYKSCLSSLQQANTQRSITEAELLTGGGARRAGQIGSGHEISVLHQSKSQKDAEDGNFPIQIQMLSDEYRVQSIAMNRLI